MAKQLHVIVGLGATGLSVAQFLKKNNIPFVVNDTREHPPQLEAFKQAFPDVVISLGGLDQALFQQADCLIVSPGISIKQPNIAAQIKRGMPVMGDIELFAQHAKKPIIAITGTNAKSTVTTLVGLMIEQAGYQAAVGGNLGLPALDLLDQPEAEFFVLELSSFQLETTQTLTPKVATVLNVTPDHMDRYDSLAEYVRIKQHVYHRADVVVCNRDDAHTASHHAKKIQFTLNQPDHHEFGLIQKNNEYFLAYQDQVLLPVHQLPILGRHYQANALAALAIGYGLGLPMDPMLETLTAFKGLAHRCQWVRERKGVCWYNDSKGTNVGATLAALIGLGQVIQGKIILIAGGLGKNADFSPLLPAIKTYVKKVVLIGADALILEKLLRDHVPLEHADSMEKAVHIADQAARAKDSVLLSPACASYDMFKNFEHRGEVFSDCVKDL